VEEQREEIPSAPHWLEVFRLLTAIFADNFNRLVATTLILFFAIIIGKRLLGP
jgi:hypothetical protein